jgi:hypothetical protein
MIHPNPDPYFIDSSKFNVAIDYIFDRDFKSIIHIVLMAVVTWNMEYGVIL